MGNWRSPCVIDGTITPNGQHFVIARGGETNVDPDQHRFVLHDFKQPGSLHSASTPKLRSKFRSREGRWERRKGHP